MVLTVFLHGFTSSGSCFPVLLIPVTVLIIISFSDIVTYSGASSQNFYFSWFCAVVTGLASCSSLMAMAFHFVSFGFVSFLFLVLPFCPNRSSSDYCYKWWAISLKDAVQTRWLDCGCSLLHFNLNFGSKVASVTGSDFTFLRHWQNVPWVWGEPCHQTLTLVLCFMMLASWYSAAGV